MTSTLPPIAGNIAYALMPDVPGPGGTVAQIHRRILLMAVSYESYLISAPRSAASFQLVLRKQKCAIRNVLAFFYRHLYTYGPCAVQSIQGNPYL